MTVGSAQRASVRGTDTAPATTARAVPLDPYRSIVFPNRLREQRRQHGFSALLGLSAAMPAIPYIRLSKIERGEVVARADELQAIAANLGIAAADLLIDIDDAGFDMARWVAQRGQQLEFDPPAEERAILLAAAFRKNRQADRDLPLATLESAYGLPPVIVSRIENAAKTPDRWNAATMAAICTVMGVADAEALERAIDAAHAEGALDPWLARLPGAAERQRRTAERVADLRAQLADGAPVATPRPETRAMLPVLGVPLADGLIGASAAGGEIAAPPMAGAASFGLRMCRATLGAGMPASAVLVVDPDVFPSPGALAVLRETVDGAEAFRVVSIGVDRNGAMTGYSAQPDKEIAIDTRDPASVLAVIAAYFP